VKTVFCQQCGTSLSEGSKFCLVCGSQVSPAQHAEQQAATQPADVEKKKKAGFFYSPAGIILSVVLGLAIIGGLVIGGIFLFKGGSSNKVDAATMKVWEEYEGLAEADSAPAAQITMDPTSLNQMRAEVEQSQKKAAALQEVAKRTTGSTRTTGKRPPTGSKADAKASQMRAILEAYTAYVKALDKFFTDLIAAVTGNQLTNADVVANINNSLAELTKLASSVKAAGGRFLDPETQAALIARAKELFPNKATSKPDGIFKNAAIFTVAKALTPKVEQSVSAARAAEAARVEAEKAAAQQAAAAAAAQQQASEMVSCPACGGTGIREGSDSSWTCTFCGGTGRVSRAKAATYVNIE
jgi:hypothetical protein